MDVQKMTEEELQAQCVAWRRWFHEHPEVSTKEIQTSQKVFDILTELGLNPVRGKGHYGVAATIQGAQPGPMVALRADMDALSVTEATGLPYASQNPGVMHACGHDMHITTLLETILRLLRRKDELAGSVRVLFQPSEEMSPTGGARYMMQDGFLDGVQGVFGLHMWPTFLCGQVGVKAGALMAGSDRIKVIIKGKTSHAGHPQEGVDAIMAAADFLQQVSHIVSRRISPLATATINFGTIQGGSRYNVVPGEVTLEGTIRTLDEDNRKKIPEFIKGILEGLKLSAGIDYDFQYFYGYPVLDNWPVPAQLAAETVRQVLGDEALVPGISPDLTAEDFGFYLQKVPGAFLWLGCGIKDQPVHGLHNAKFCPDEQALVVGSRLMSQLAINALQQLKAGKDFSART
ncbi:M20 metallopeptidase family protein [Acidaminococcus provencensis]|jgi:amidohydrolase|uniref:M20 metallopeptidase family protein n=1 Tax=Acidaminococcus provencensis TaxID=2058289 RepID=UPI000CF9C84B|nr:M20 family metallopeptidase [Acidaminococcus provencensis]